ncbi:hypothetical protein B0A49_13434 [Cryomyces minteri]|uniref:AMP-activated protein kinase glycogen-binding domain-containing protein n=1 Tax=Cryomyces minteri TaxID=331657 RepID=A0A4U0UYY5_9PEZI|nr:hypothetical protein B0A49_13434 [Cryomyces minteri]
MGSYTFKWYVPSASPVLHTVAASAWASWALRSTRATVRAELCNQTSYETSWNTADGFCGTFDDWAKSEKLERKGDHFEKTVQLAVANEKIYYKFVVDGNWTTDHTAPSERDGAYNVNNILLPEEIQHSSPTAHTLSSAAPQSRYASASQLLHL